MPKLNNERDRTKESVPVHKVIYRAIEPHREMEIKPSDVDTANSQCRHLHDIKLKFYDRFLSE